MEENNMKKLTIFSSLFLLVFALTVGITVGFTEKAYAEIGYCDTDCVYGLPVCEPGYHPFCMEPFPNHAGINALWSYGECVYPGTGYCPRIFSGCCDYNPGE
jgi:hypothetical protein